MRTLGVSTTVNANVQNEINTSIIFNYLCENDLVYRAKIAEDLGISAPAVSRAIMRLIRDGFVKETGKIPTGKGKKATQLYVNADRGIIVGADLIKSPTRIAISDLRGTPISKHDGFVLNDATDVVKELTEEIDRLLDVHRVGSGSEGALGELNAICVGIPSALSGPSHQRIVAPLYRALEGLDLGTSLGVRYDVPVYVENVVKLSALAEAQFGAASAYSEVAFVEVSNGIGLGTIIDSQQLAGAHGASGELGFMLVGVENLPFEAQYKGFLEQYASVEGIAREAVKAVQMGERSSMLDFAHGELGSISASVACMSALRGDPVARRIIERAVQYLSVAIINVVLILDPQVVVIGGDICRLPGLEALFIEPIRHSAARIVPFEMPPIAVSSLGEDAGVIGATYFAVDSLVRKKFPYKLS